MKSFHSTVKVLLFDYQSKKYNFQEMDTFEYIGIYTRVYLHL